VTESPAAEAAPQRKAPALRPGRVGPSEGWLGAGLARTWQELQDRLEERRLRLIALDITPTTRAPAPRRDALVVMRAIVPGLIPISFGFGTEPMATVVQAIPSGARRSPLGMRRRFPHPFA